MKEKPSYDIIITIEESTLRKEGRTIKRSSIKNIALSVRELLNKYFDESSEDYAFEAFLRGTAAKYLTENSFADEADVKFLSGLMPDVFCEDKSDERVIAAAEAVKDILDVIPSEVWQGNVQLAGQLYQYCNIAKKEAILGGLKNNSKVSAEYMAAATQIFTPDWIVRYMTENTLGKVMFEWCGFDTSGLEYFIPHGISGKSEPQEIITLIDPCVGSGNILVYAFELFMEYYRQRGTENAQAVRSIFEDSLFGLDIDSRVCRIARFALMMKAAAYCRDVIYWGITPNIYDMEDIGADVFRGSEQFGSLIRPLTPPDGKEKKAAAVFSLLTRKYSAVVTNPPYMSCNSMNAELLRFVKKEYPDYHADLFSAFTVRCTELADEQGCLGFLTPYVWMFIQSYEKLRKMIFSEKTLETLIHFEYSAFDGATVPVCAFTLRNCRTSEKGLYFRLTEFRGGLEIQREKFLEAASERNCGYVYETAAEEFAKLPDSPAAYWVSERVRELYEKYPPLGSVAAPRKGNSTSDNDRFLRLWYEVDKNKLNLDSCRIDREDTLIRRWFPYNKGGGYRKWYGFNDYVIDWYDDAAEIRKIPTAVIANYRYFTKAGLTWSTVTSGRFSIRQFGEGFIFDNGGCCIFELGEKKNYICALLNSKVFAYIFGQLNPTLNFQSGEVAKFPFVYESSDEIDRLTEECTALSKEEYDSFEVSRDFRRHPLI